MSGARPSRHVVHTGAGPRAVEVPIEAGEEVDLDEKVRVRPKLD